MNTNTTTTKPQTAAMDRLRYLVGVASQPQYMTRSGIMKDKTKEQREQEWALATEVVMFAFDHAGITGGHLTPGGLLMELMDEF